VLGRRFDLWSVSKVESDPKSELLGLVNIGGESWENGLFAVDDAFASPFTVAMLARSSGDKETM
jgi:hypothetical protein